MCFGEARVVGTDRAAPLADVAARAESAAELVVDDSWTPPDNTYPNGTHVCELEVDPDTGAVEILRYTVVDDFGVVLNPLLLAGQVHGGVAQGVGQALLERTLYEPGTGLQTLLAPAELSQSQIQRVLEGLLVPGVDAADLYFQYRRREHWSLEDSLVRDAGFGLEQGVGVRVISGEKTGFAYSEELALPALTTS